jgi:aminobenzoyl-glutamate utilization protein B
MTGTRVEEIFEDACASILSNHHMADLQYQAMKSIGPIYYTEEEQAYAKKINDRYPKGTMEGLAKTNCLPKEYVGQPLVGENFPALDIDDIFTGSSDVGDLSMKAPLSMLVTACWPSGAPAHTWGVVATGAMSIGHKGMLHAAKTMAIAALDLYSDPALLRKVRREFGKAILEHPYKCPIPDQIQPPSYKQEA